MVQLLFDLSIMVCLNGGNAILRIEATDSQGAKVEKTINLTIEKIEANLEISRTASTQDVVPVNGEIKLNYLINPKKITGNAAKNLSSNEVIHIQCKLFRELSCQFGCHCTKRLY